MPTDYKTAQLRTMRCCHLGALLSVLCQGQAAVLRRADGANREVCSTGQLP